jgi:hypothetical protein
VAKEINEQAQGTSKMLGYDLVTEKPLLTKGASKRAKCISHIHMLKKSPTKIW